MSKKQIRLLVFWENLRLDNLLSKLTDLNQERYKPSMHGDHAWKVWGFPDVMC